MIRDLPSTSTAAVSKELITLRNDVGAMAMGRVLTLLVPVGEEDADAAIRAANDATRQHPARILVLVSANSRGKGRLDAQIRVGGDAGASEIVVLRLYGELSRQQAAVVTPLLLPDSPIVAWWPGESPKDVAASPVGQMAHRRITDADANGSAATQLRRRAQTYLAGDTDLAWTRITRWRALLASSLEAAPFEPVLAATVTGAADDPGADLLAGWLAHALRTRVTRVRSAAGVGLVNVRLDRESGPIDLVRSEDGTDTAVLARAGTMPRLVALRTPSLAEALAEELRRLDADEIYATALQDGMPQVRRGGTRTEAVRAGKIAAGPAEVSTGGSPAVRADRLARAQEPSDETSQDGIRERVRQELDDAEHADTKVLPDQDAVAEAVVDALIEVVVDAVRSRGIAHVALTGGSMGTAVMTALAARARRGDLERSLWRDVHLWWGDERYLPDNDPERNDTQADEAGLGEVPVLAKHVHRIPSGAGRDRIGEATARYATELATWAEPPREQLSQPAAKRAHPPVPRFDVLLLGVGPDGHVASLFPGHAALRLVTPSTTAVTDSPKPPPERVTLTLPAINAGRAVWLVVSGADKADAVARSLAAREDHEVPASCVRGTSATVWWLDEAAASRLD
ncbi:6-phosphogluconolactonase [Ornithinimicrobium sp. Y1847]|uniref:6-phosphogluconolactonase n=1 Tax=Ornithinimicrobium sp. Y1847 TaxID=3405419 RepID=UPI003B6771EA